MHASVEEWAAYMRAAGSSEDTVRTRTSGVETLRRYSGLADPREVATRHIIAWLGACESSWSRRTYFVTVRRWCDFLLATGQREDDPCEGVPRPRQPRGIPRPVSERVVRKVLLDPPGHRAYAYVALASFAGLRVSEIARVRGEDVAGSWLFVCGKGQQQAWIPLHPVLQTLAKGMPEVGFWFPGVHDGHVAPATVSQVIRAAFRGVGSGATAHQCRHLLGSSVLHATGNTRLAQRALRHESLTSTQIYTEVTNAELEAAIAHLPWAG